MEIFVGSLPFKMQERELREIFEKYGEVLSAKIIIDHQTRQNKGFGFVKMPNDNQARHAISELNGVEVEGRPLVVNEAQFRKGSEKPGEGRSGGPREGRSRENNFGDRPERGDRPDRRPFPRGERPAGPPAPRGDRTPPPPPSQHHDVKPQPKPRAVDLDPEEVDDEPDWTPPPVVFAPGFKKDRGDSRNFKGKKDKGRGPEFKKSNAEFKKKGNKGNEFRRNMGEDDDDWW